MNETSASRAETLSTYQTSETVLVWDAPVRVFHWLTVGCFAGAYITAESESWRLLHVTLGYTMGGLVAFRIIWGFIGTRHARFKSFLRAPSVVLRYLQTLIQGRPQHYTGHNPAGALAIMALLVLAVGVSLSGFANFNELGGGWLKELHEVTANLMLAMIGVHIAGVFLASWKHHENLIGAMITGRKPGSAKDGVRKAWNVIAALMLVTVAGFWWLQWKTAPTGSVLDNSTTHVEVHKRGREHD
jgi:cytochrome b